MAYPEIDPQTIYELDWLAFLYNQFLHQTGHSPKSMYDLVTMIEDDEQKKWMSNFIQAWEKSEKASLDEDTDQEVYDIAMKWLEEIGSGFHPDNDATDYDPPLKNPSEYNADIYKLRIIDPYYKICSDAMEDYHDWFEYAKKKNGI